MLKRLSKIVVMSIMGMFVTQLYATTLKIATIAPEGSAWLKTMRAGTEAIKKRTENRVDFRIYPGGVQGNHEAVLRKIRLGQLQGGAFASAELASTVPDAQVYALPFLFKNQNEVDAVRAEVDPLVKSAFERQGLVAVGMAGGGFTYLMGTQPLRSRSDLQNSKVWVPAGDTISEAAFADVGVQPVPLPLSDVFTALTTGLVNVVGNTFSGAIIFQWHTRIKFIANIPLTYVMGVLVLDKKVMDKLDKADKEIVREEIGTAFDQIDQQNRRDNLDAREVLVKQGITIEQPSEKDLEFWDQVGEKSRARFIKTQSSASAVYQAVSASLEKYRNGQASQSSVQ